MPEFTKPVRAFVAINLPADLLATIGELQREFRSAAPGEGIRWVQPEQIHLTLRFLGNVSENQLPDVESALLRACPVVGPFLLRARGAGCFPDPRRPRILWVGLEGSLDDLRRLQTSVESETAQWGERDEREFHPHLTMGRVKNADPGQVRSIERKLEQVRGVALGEWQVSQVELMRSDLSSSGPRYTCLAAVPLGVRGDQC